MATCLPAESVVADMERIFGPLGERVRLTALPDTGGARRPARPGHGLKALTLAAPALVLLVSLALAIGYARRAKPPAAPAQLSSAQPMSGTPKRAMVAPSIISAPARLVAAPVASSLAVASAAGHHRHRAVHRRLALDQAGPADARRLAAPLRKRKQAPPAKLAGRGSSAAPRAWAIGHAARAVHFRRAAADTRSVADTRSAPHCSPESMDDRCIYQDVLNADARLRRAYDRAQRSGVATSRLATISRRWRQATKHAQDDPEETIRRYDRLADTLDRQRAEQ